MMPELGGEHDTLVLRKSYVVSRSSRELAALPHAGRETTVH
jgi:hypothetical protein